MRDLNKRKYLFAFIITSAIFFLGFFFGFLMDLKRVDYFQTVNEVQKINIRSLQLQNELLKNGASTNQCGAFRFMFDRTLIELENTRGRLELYNQQSKINKEEFDLIKREYTLSQINFWYISKSLKESCTNASDFVTVIYFFSDKKKCPECENQATVLDYYKSILQENLLIFSIDEEFESQEPIITLLKYSYNINEYPTLIINNKVYNTTVSKEEMKDILCSQYKTNVTRSIICN